MGRASGWLAAVALIATVGLPGTLGCERTSSGNGTTSRNGTPPALDVKRTVTQRAPTPTKTLSTDAPHVMSDRLIADIVERTSDSVVNIFSTRTEPAQQLELPEELQRDPFFRRFFEDGPFSQERNGSRRTFSLGSGFVVSKDGLILTNSHVVEEALDIQVAFPDGREFDAEVLGSDPHSDLAVIKLEGDPGNLEPLPLADSSELRVGEFVLAIGNPYGVGQAVTLGIVSALGRAGLGIVDYEDFIQTDAAINPGNSGGPLVNLDGEVVGINIALLSETGGYAGISFAVPSNMARMVFDELVEYGRVIRGFLGVAVQDLTPDLAAALDISIDDGVLISDVTPGSPAARAGLVRGDVVTAVEGTRVGSAPEMRNLIASFDPGRRIVLQVRRDGQRIAVPATLGEVPAEAEEEEPIETAAPDEAEALGLSIGALTPELRSRLEVPPEVGGVVVMGVREGTVAQLAELQPGDVIVQVGQQPVRSVEAAARALRSARGPVLLLVWREGSTFYTVLEK